MSWNFLQNNITNNRKTIETFNNWISTTWTQFLNALQHHLHVLMHLCDKAFLLLLQFKGMKNKKKARWKKVNSTTNERKHYKKFNIEHWVAQDITNAQQQYCLQNENNKVK